MQVLDTLTTTLPVILLVIVGLIIRRIGLIKPQTTNDLKKMVVNITLPLLLFKAFSTMQFEFRYLTIILLIFVTNLVVLVVSTKLRFIPALSSKFSAYLMVGFEAGMLGYAVFSSIYGETNIPKFAVVDLGQVLFVFLILIPSLEYQQSRQLSIPQIVLFALKTPVIIAIILGVLANWSGAYLAINTTPIASSLLQAAEMLAGLTAPLVALIIGYELNFQPSSISKSLQTVALRLVVWVSLALALNAFVIRAMLGLDRIFEAAVLLMAVLPAPFVIPLYLREGEQADRDYILNTLSLGIVVALAASIIIKLVYNI